MGTLGAAAGLGAEECQQAPLEERAPLGGTGRNGRKGGLKAQTRDTGRVWVSLVLYGSLFLLLKLFLFPDQSQIH